MLLGRFFFSMVQYNPSFRNPFINRSFQPLSTGVLTFGNVSNLILKKMHLGRSFHQTICAKT